MVTVGSVHDASTAGHRLLPHTADLIIEAWALERERCIEEAALALVESFVDAGGAEPHAEHAVTLPADGDAELLIAALDEVIYLVDARGVVPVRVTVAPRDDGGISVLYATVSLRSVEPIGPVPKGVTRHRLRFGVEDGTWHCSVVVDV